MLSEHIKEHEILGTTKDIADLKTGPTQLDVRVQATEAHVADEGLHVTAAWKLAMEAKSAVYYRATIAERDAIPVVKEGDICRVGDDGSGNFASYIRSATSWDVLSKQDWENLNLTWASIIDKPDVPSFAGYSFSDRADNPPAPPAGQVTVFFKNTLAFLRDATGAVYDFAKAIGAASATDLENEVDARENADSGLAFVQSSHEALTDAHGATSAATASRIISRDANGRAQIATPSVDEDIANKSYVDSTVVAAGAGSVNPYATSGNVVGNFVSYKTTDGKTIQDSGYAPSVASTANTVLVRRSDTGINAGALVTSANAVYVGGGYIQSAGVPVLLHAGDGTNSSATSVRIRNNAGKFEVLNNAVAVVASVDSTGKVSANQLASTVSTGTAPLIVASTTKVTNLNADLLDGYNTSTTASASTIPVYNASARLVGDITGNAATATIASSATSSSYSEGVAAYGQENPDTNKYKFFEGIFTGTGFAVTVTLPIAVQDFHYALVSYRKSSDTTWTSTVMVSATQFTITSATLASSTYYWSVIAR